MKQAISLFLLILINNILFCQSDCTKIFKYSGVVKIKGFEIEKILLPSASSLEGDLKFNEIGGYLTVKPTTDNFEKKSGTYMSSEFCKSPNEVIEVFFKSFKKYPIEIIEKKKDHMGEYKTLKFDIPIEQITFRIIEDNIIEIILPKIE